MWANTKPSTEMAFHVNGDHTSNINFLYVPALCLQGPFQRGCAHRASIHHTWIS